MRIVIDMQGAQTESRFRGIGRYSLSLAQGIVRNSAGHEVYLLLNGMLPDSIDSIRTAFIGLLPQSHIRVWYAEGPVSASDPANRVRREVAERVRQACIDDLHPDVVHICSSVEGYIDDAVIGSPQLDQQALVSATLYDLIPLVSPGQYLDNNPGYKAHYLDKVEAYKHYGLLLSISEFARQEALSLLPLASERVVNVSTAANDVFRPVEMGSTQRQALAARFGVREPFVLYSGGADERKNLPRLIEAFAKVKRELGNVQLVFAGRMPQFHVDLYRATARSHGLADTDLVFTGYITDEELVALYNACQLYVFPSWHEGFGLPPLEAMKCGAAVIGANTSSVPEVIGLEEATFDPLDTQALAAKMRQALEDEAFRERLAAHGLQRAEAFSWDLTGKAAVQAFEQALAQRQADKPAPVAPATDALQALIDDLAVRGLLQAGAVDIPRLAKAIDYSLQGPASKPQLFVDISELSKHDGKSGIQRVVRSILLEWLNNPPEAYDIRPVYTLAGEAFYRYASRFTAKFMGQAFEHIEDEAISYRAGDVYLCLDLLMDVLPHKRSYLDTLRSHGVNIFFVVYDLLILQLPHCFVESLQAHYRTWIHAVAQYDGALCISHAVADELRDWLVENDMAGERPFRIGAFHLGADIDQSMPSTGIPQDPAKRLEALADNPNFLMVGTLEPRKGHTQALEAFERLWAAGVQANLVIVGKHGWLVDELAAKLNSHPEAGKRLLWLEGASDEYLEYLYNNCDCLVAASYGEGFGLPLIEAAQYHLPIIARDIPVFREVAGEHAWFFEGSDAQAVADSIGEWLKLHAEGRHPQSSQMPWLTWRASAQQLIGEIDKYKF